MKTAEKRRKIIAWWVFYKCDSVEDPLPDDFEEWIKTALQNPNKCHEILQTEYRSYDIPNKPRIIACF